MGKRNRAGGRVRQTGRTVRPEYPEIAINEVICEHLAESPQINVLKFQGASKGYRVIVSLEDGLYYIKSHPEVRTATDAQQQATRLQGMVAGARVYKKHIEDISGAAELVIGGEPDNG